jgi:hypothetical protein
LFVVAEQTRKKGRSNEEIQSVELPINK